MRYKIGELLQSNNNVYLKHNFNRFPCVVCSRRATVRSSNQSLLATLLQALNDPSTEMYCLIRPPNLEECTIFVTKDVR